MQRGPPGNVRLSATALLLTFAVIGAVPSAVAVTAAAPISLAIAAVVAPYSPLLSVRDKRLVARLLEGGANVEVSPRISVKADSIVCRVSNVDITLRGCELTFGTYKRGIEGRAANELYATLAAAGLTAEGAAGSMIESLRNLDCTLMPGLIRQKAGGGAECTFETGP